jgi:hypothetical protein
MLKRTRVMHRIIAILAGPALLIVLGCSNSEIGTLYPVSGIVKYKGEPVLKAKISFVPKASGSTHGATGEVENGAYKLTTMTAGDGALPGDYFVTVSAREVDEAKLKDATEKYAAKYKLGKMDQYPPELLAKARKEAKSSVPAKYEKADTSGLKATVGQRSEQFDFDLTD